MLLNQVKIRRLTWPLQNITLFFTFKYSWVAFAVCFGSSSIWTMKQCPISFSPFGWIWADSISLYTSELIRLLLSSVSSSLNTSNPVPLEVMYAHAITLPPPCFTDDIVCFWSWAVPSLLHTFFFPSFWYRLILISAIQRMLFQKCSGFLDVFWQRLIRPCLHLVVNPLYLLWWSLLLIVDFDSDTSASWRVFFSWLDVMKGFFFTMERILRSSTTFVLRGHPGLCMLLSSIVCSFFSECTKHLIWPLLMFLLSLWWICFVFEA